MRTRMITSLNNALFERIPRAKTLDDVASKMSDTVSRGPASVPQPRWDVRVEGGRVFVRAA